MNLITTAQRQQRLGDYPSALKTYRKALASIKDTDSDYLSCVLGVADTLRVLGNFQEARKFYKEALAHSKKNSREHQLDSLIGIALCDKGEGNYGVALLKLKKIIKYAQRFNDLPAKGFVFWNIGMIYRFIGELNKSKKFLKASCELFKRTKDMYSLGFALCGLAGCLRAEGDVKKSFEYYLVANKLFKRYKDAYGLAYSYCGMANALKADSKIKKAIFYYGKSEVLYKKVNDLSSLGFVYKGLGGCYARTGCDILKNFYFQKALKLFKRADDSRGMVSLFLEKLSHHYDKKTYDLALKISLRRNLKTEIKYLKSYIPEKPSKWLG